MFYYKANSIPFRRNCHNGRYGPSALVLNLRNIPDDIRHFYSIHDCLGCKESDAERLKEIMENVSMELFGVKLGLKIESGTAEEQNNLIGKFDYRKVLRKRKERGL